MQRTSLQWIVGIVLINIVLFSVGILAAQTGTWETVVADNLPIARHETSFVHVGGKFYLIGGRESRIVQIYDPVTGEWTNGATAPEVMHHIQPVIVDNLIYVVSAYSGNCCDDETGLENNYIYDPVQNKWMTGGAIPDGRQRGAAGVVFYEGSFYIAGGLTGGHGLGGDGISAESHNWFDVWNPYTNVWQALPDMPRARDHFGAAIVGTKLYAAAGRTSIGTSSFNKTIPEVDVYDFGTGLWETLPASANIPTQRAGTGVAVIGNEILVIGGEGGAQSTGYDDTEAFDTVNQTWRTLDTLNQGRHGTTAALCNGIVYIAAGSPVRGGGNIDTMERYYETVALDCPAATISPGTLNSDNNGGFGQVEVGDSAVKTVTITNSGGNQALMLTGFSKTGSADFAATFPHTLPISLAPGMSVEVSVTYTPAGLGADTGTLSFTRHNSNQPLLVALSGEGVDEVVETATATNMPPPTSTTDAATTATNTPTSAASTAASTAPSTATSQALTATLEMTGTPVIAATSTATVATITPAGVDLIDNGDFEAKDDTGKPDLLPWSIKFLTQEKIKCNKVGKPPFTPMGECAFRFKGSVGENSKLIQNATLITFAAGDTLDLSLFVNASSDTATGKVKVRVKYSDSTPTGKINRDIIPTAGYVEITAPYSLASSSVSKIKVQIDHKSTSGKLYVDEVSLRHTPAQTLPLP